MSGNDRHDESATDFPEVDAILRGLAADPETLERPPSDLWERIEAAVAADPASEPTTPDLDTSQTGANESVVVPISRRRNRAVVFVGAAAAVAVLFVVGIVAATRDDTGTEPVVAEAELTFDAENFDALGAGATAQADLIERSDGTYELRIVDADLPAPAAGEEDLEVWLIEPDEAGNPVDMVTLGLVDPNDPGVFEIPAGYDPAAFFVVDISIEPRDGVPTHSGRSILRGPLEVA